LVLRLGDQTHATGLAFQYFWICGDWTSDEEWKAISNRDGRSRRISQSSWRSPKEWEL